MDLRATGTITFLFTDLEGSTRLWEQHPDAMRVALARHDAILRSAIGVWGGRVVKATGDGMMAVFGSACDAAMASVAAQRDLAGGQWPETGPLRVRMGVHAGEAEERDGDYFGPTVNRAARIMAAGHGGQVLLSASAGALASERLPEGAALLDLGEHRLKDLGRPEHLFQLVHPDLPSSFPPLAVLRPAGASLPAMATELVGRRAELAEIRDRIGGASTRLLTLTGPGGTGKTALAVRAAEDLGPGFPDGVTFVDISGARDTHAVLVAIARSVGLGEAIDRPLQEELTDLLRERRMLLLLDNFEQVTAAAGAVAQLLRDCPRLVVLATSREALHVRAEHIIRVPPLALPPVAARRESAADVAGYEAVALFVDRARAVRPDFSLTDETAPAVADICRRLDGLPLAIELAAARLRLFSPDVLRDRLGDRLGLLRSGPRDLPERQQTLRAAMDWSYELLEPGEQRLFEILAVFADAGVSAVEAVVAQVNAIDGVGIDVLDGLAGLIDKSLLREADVPGGEPRMAMLETIREFAADRLAQRPDVDARARLVHATYFADEARRLRPALVGSEPEAALREMAAEVANMRLAWSHWVTAGDLEQLEKMADGLLILDDARGWYLDAVALTSDMLAVLGAGAAAPERVGQEIALRVSLARALMATQGFTPQVEDALNGALALFERGGDIRQQHAVLRGLASLYQFRAQFDRADVLGREILALGEREGDPRILVDGHLVVGSTLAFVESPSAGLEHLDRAIALFTAGPPQARTARIGNDPRVACYTTSGFALWLQGYPDRAVERMDAALALADDLKHPFTTAYARFHSGLLHLWRREPHVVLDRAAGLIEIADEHGFPIWIATGRCLLGSAQVALGRPDEGLAAMHGGMEQYRGLRSPLVFWPMLLFLDALASHGAGRNEAGLEPIDAAIEIMSAGSGATVLPEFHLLKGDLLAALGVVDATGRPGAEPWYRRAFERAGELGAGMTRLRAATRLGRLALAEGRPDAVAGTLAPIYATFAEGLGTADLVEARDLLAAAGAGAIAPPH